MIKGGFFKKTILNIAFLTILSSPIAAQYGPNDDFDNDGIINSVDLDDDNDGITDINEGACLVSSSNASFELPSLPCATPSYHTIPDSEVPDWSHTGTKDRRVSCGAFAGSINDSNMEIWNSGFNGIPAPDGVQFIEVNANFAGGKLYQPLNIPAGEKTVIVYSFYHRGRDGDETIRAGIGTNLNYIDFDEFTAGVGDWDSNSGIFKVPDGSTSLQVIIESLISGGAGNLIDAVEACVSRDTDGDGIPDYLDSDSDNDGCPDVVEAGHTDANADGKLDGTGIGANGKVTVVSPSTGYTGNKAAVTDSTQNSACCDASKSGFTDTDGDNVADDCDLDDDNDGIIDTNEGYQYSCATQVPDTATTTATNFASTRPLVNTYDNNYSTFGGTISSTSLNGSVTYRYDNTLNDVSKLTIISNGGSSNADGQLTNIASIQFFDDNNVLIYSLSNVVVQQQSLGNTEISLPNLQNVSYFVLDGLTGVTEVIWREISLEACKDIVTDTDNDGIPDYLDPDSDNDGCPDVVEAGHTDANADGKLDGTGVDTDGKVIFTPPATGYTGNKAAVTDSTQNSACCDASKSGFTDTDGDNVADECDLDDDNDGILDINEGFCSEPLKLVIDPTSTTFSITNSVGTVSTTTNYVANQNPAGDASPLAPLPYLNGYDTDSNLGGVEFYYNNPVDLYIDSSGQLKLTIYYYDNIAQGSGIYLSSASPFEIMDGNNNIYTGSFTLTSSDVTALDQGQWISKELVFNVGSNRVFEFKGFSGTVENINGGAGSAFSPSGSEVFALAPNTVSGCTGNRDTDSDGIPDYLDLDSDGDGCPDVSEAKVAEYLRSIDEEGVIIDASVTNPSGTNMIADSKINPNNGGDTVGPNNGFHDKLETGTAGVYAGSYDLMEFYLVPGKQNCICYEVPGTGTTVQTKVGISTLDRARVVNSAEWPYNLNGGFMALESKEKGFVVPRLSDPAVITTPKEGMLIYDTTANCLKIYDGITDPAKGDGTGWTCLTQRCTNN